MNKPQDSFSFNPPEVVGDPQQFQRLLSIEKVPVPDYLKPSSPAYGNKDLPVSRYIDPAIHRLEAEKLWPKVWQFVAREEEIPKPGAHVVYDIVNSSIILMRGDDGEIRGFHNSCLHRGRALRTQGGVANRLRCPFHGFTWSLQGHLSSMPTAWDFEHLQKEKMDLPQVRVETWGGFVFINFDLDAPPLLEHLGVVPEHFKSYAMERSCTIVHVQRRLPCNWKVGQEAFFESLHVKTTHPGIMTFTGDVDSQYDIYGDHVARAITPMGVVSPNLDGVTEARILQDILDMSGRMSESEGDRHVLPAGMSAREYVGELNRAAFQAASGDDLSAATWAELQDAILYDVFPNFQVWAGYFGNIVYRFIPDGDNHESCLFDVYVLGRYPAGAECPPAAPVNRLADNQPFTDAPELGALGPVFEEDMCNLSYLMKGLKASKKGAVSLASYQESRIRHHHVTLAKYLGLGDDAA